LLQLHAKFNGNLSATFKITAKSSCLAFYGHGVVYRPTVDRCRLCIENSENIVTFCHIFESVLFSISGLFTAIFFTAWRVCMRGLCMARCLSVYISVTRWYAKPIIKCFYHLVDPPL